jgi:2'-deoxynucleoside 5'-phosphate N-hydrolase
MKKIYFACSIRGGRDDSLIYAELVTLINKHAKVLSELFGSEDLPHSDHQKMSDKDIYARDIDWLKEADAVIAEVTTPSLGVGYEIAKADEWHKPILALYRLQPGKKLSAMITASPGTKVIEYQEVKDLDKTIVDFLNSL